MNILTIWVWAFGFAILKLLWDNNNSNNKITWYCIDENIVSSINSTREHAYFFKWYKLPECIEVVWNLKNPGLYDLIIIAVPSKFVRSVIGDIKWQIKPWVIILNLAKWINNENLKTLWETIKEDLWEFNYKYASLSGWMIAEELVSWAPLWADIWVEDTETWELLKNLFKNKNLNINITSDVKNIELYGSLKNIMAILSGYYTWKGHSLSTIWKYLSEYYEELKEIIFELWWNKNINFWDYSLWWDIIATCFWNSRNREFWELLWKWFIKKDALEKMKQENKYVEWYETLKAVYQMIKDKPWFEMTKDLYNKIFIEVPWK